MKRVNFLISWWLEAIRLNNAIGLFDINKVAEDVALKLLNEIYGFQLENLNYEKKNYPGIDLGDKINKIGFQITSRNDLRKFCLDIGKFFKGPNKIYSNGIRFLTMNREKKPKFNKDFNQKICPNFEPDKHILNAKDLMEEIQRIYGIDKEKFYRIKEILETEIAGKSMRRENLKLIRFKLLEGSKKYYKELNGPTGRFKLLRISDIILPQPQNEWINQQVKLEGEENIFQNILEALPILWKKVFKHSVILGEGGMGKTVSLVRLWGDYLKKQLEKTPIPIFIALNEYNQISNIINREDFIVSMIKRNYGDGEIRNEDIWEIMKTPLKNEENYTPSIILLLDGFNEITIDKRELLIEIRRLIEQASGIQINITSRFDMREDLNWIDFNLFKLIELEDKNVESYLHEQGILLDTNENRGIDKRIKKLIKNPMMLSLYASICEIQKNHLKDKNCEFKNRVETPGELLWNFFEAHVARLPERLSYNSTEWWLRKLLIKFILPALGYEMERIGHFQFSIDELDIILKRYLKRFCQLDFLQTFREYIDHSYYWAPLNFKPIEWLKKIAEIKKILTKEMAILVEEGDSYRFLHHNFRDFFASLHILNEVSIALKKRKISVVLMKKPFSLYVCRYLGEILGLQYTKPIFINGKGWKMNNDTESPLYKTLSLCRFKFDENIGFAIWNILTIFKEVREELTGIDLSNLDLSKISIFGVRCSRYYRDTYISTNFDGAKLHYGNIFPWGHGNVVNQVIYNSNETKILSASADRTIKEWDLETGQCLKTFFGHNDWVTSAIYNNDETKILSASWDGTVKEWNIKTTKCIKTFKGHRSRVNCAIYSINGKKILSASDDNTINEWDTDTGQIIKTYIGHLSAVKRLSYRFDDKRFISASFDGIIKEWDVETGDCIITIKGHSDKLNDVKYNLDGTKLISASRDKTIKEWDSRTGNCLKIFRGNTDWIFRVMYSPDCKKIISASIDGYIKEWDVESGECLRSLKAGASYAIYNSDGSKILSNRMESIKEWDSNTLECLRDFKGHSKLIENARLNSEGEKVLIACHDNTIKEFVIERKECTKIFIGHLAEVNDVVYSLDENKILSASKDGTIKEWDVESGECLKTFDGHSGSVVTAIYSPDCHNIFSISKDTTIKEWDIETGACIKTFVGHTAPVNSIVISGENMLTTSDDNTIKMWNIKIGECQKIYEGHTKRVTDAIFSKDTKKILSISWDNSIKEWDVETTKCLRTLRGHSSEISKAIYMDEGKKIFSVSKLPKIKIWDTKTGKCIKTFKLISPDPSGYAKTIFGKLILMIHFGKILILKPENYEFIMTLQNIPNLFINGCSFKKLHPESKLSEDEKAIMKQYGAVFD